MDHQTALNKAKIALMSRPDSTFFTTVCFSMKHLWDENIPTACTNGTEIRFNPEFFMNLTPDERVFLLLHETMHVAFMHMARLNDRIPAKWNVAADHVINLMLLERGYVMPAKGLADPRYTGMSTEEVYKLLPDNEQCEDMDLRPSDEDPEILEDKLQEILVRASVQSAMAGDSIGSIPGDIQIYLQKLLKPKLPWNRILQKFMNALAKNDYTFKTPNRRFFPKHHLPSLKSERLADIAVAVDASGSVSDKDFTTFIGEVNGILRMMKPEVLTMIQFDTKIKAVDKVRSIKELSKLKFTGRGGTRIDEVMQWARENRPQLLLMFTDGYFTFRHDHDPKVPVVWLIHNNPEFTAPFGKVIHYEIEK